MACLVSSVGFSLNASALEITNGGSTWFRACEMFFGYPPANGVHVDVQEDAQGHPINSSYDCAMTRSFSHGTELKLTNLKFYIKGSVLANELINFNITYDLYSLPVSSGASERLLFEYGGLQFGPQDDGVLILNESCVDENSQTYTERTLTCSYLALVTKEVTSLRTMNGTTILYSYEPNYDTTLKVRVSGITTRRISYNGLTSDDRAWLEQHMPADSSPAQIEQAIVDAQQQAREDERQELDDEASDYQSELEDNPDQQAIETKMSSILAIIEDFVFAIGRPVISTCILPMDFRAYTGAGFYEVDLCHLSPPSGITTVLNVVFIFFVLGLAYSAIRSVISMYKEVIDG